MRRRLVRRGASAMLVVALVGTGLSAPPAAAWSPPETDTVSPAAGPVAGGTMVTINGRNLDSVRRVYFGRTYVTSITHLSSTRITTRAPAETSGSVTVRAATSTGYSGGPHLPWFRYMTGPAIMKVLPGTGDGVHVYGYNLYSPRIMFGSRSATRVRVVSYGEVVALAPPNTFGPVAVTMTTPSGRSRAVTVVRHHFAAIPRITSLDGGSSSVAGNTALHVTGVNFSSVRSVTVAGIKADGVFTAYNGAIDVYTPPHAPGTVPVVVTTAWGTSAPAAYTYNRPATMTWAVSKPFQVNQGHIRAISCVSSGFCVAVDAGSAVVRQAGVWSAPTPLPGAKGLVDVSCSSAAYCLAVDGGGRAWTWTGSWSTSQSIAPMPTAAVSCPADGQCFAVGGGYADAWNDGAWGPRQQLPTGGWLVGITCPATNLCFANDGLRPYRYDGATWTASTYNGVGIVSSVSCASTTYCVAVSGSNRTAIFDGAAWNLTTAVVPLDGHAHLSCLPTTTFCGATDIDGGWSSFDGTSWSTASRIDPSPYSATRGDWGFACSSPTSCVEGDYSGRIYSFDGTTWSAPQQVYVPTALTSDVSCWSAAWCRAIDGAGSVSTWDGTSWSDKIPVMPGEPLGGHISCRSADLCAAVAGYGQATHLAGSTWSTPTGVGPLPYGFTGLSCPTATFCLAISYSGAAFGFNGTTWSAVASTSLPGANGMTCASPTMCFAFAANRVALFDGTNWHAPVIIDPNAPGRSLRYVNAMSCATASFCIAVDSLGQAITSSGGVWHPAQPVTHMDNHLDAITCLTTTFCVALAHNHAVVFDGKTWSEQVSMNADPATFDILNAISCGSPTSCVAVGSTDVVTGNPSG